ncbi:MAG: hypothetical protein AAGL10_08120 [Pseudomonadota bacterium]
MTSAKTNVIAGFLLVWSLAYCGLVYFSFITSSPEAIDDLVKAGTIKPEYAQYIRAIPDWVRALSVGLAVLRVLGSIGLLLRKAWAFEAFSLAFVITMVIMFRGFVIAGVADVIRPSQIFVEIAFIAVSLFAVWFSKRCKTNLARSR